MCASQEKYILLKKIIIDRNFIKNNEVFKVETVNAC